VLLIQSLPYAATVLVSLVNALELPGRWIGETGADAPAPAYDEPAGVVGSFVEEALTEESA
jgi:hypothetical protein